VLVWHASSKPYQDYPKLGSRFISEFGISSLPHVKTIESYLRESSLSERHPHSRTVDSHNKETLHERKLATYLVENFRYNYGLEEYIYISQLLQAEAMTCAMRTWRREWKGPGREYCGGSLIWQVSHPLGLNIRKIDAEIFAVQPNVASDLQSPCGPLLPPQNGLLHCEARHRSHLPRSRT
jgi:hypothetical protein